MQDHPNYQKMRKPNIDLDVVQPRLTMAWSTEFLMSVEVDKIGQNEPIRYANGWLPVQAYYAIYHGVAAFNHLTQPSSKNTHAWNLRQVDQFLENNDWIPSVYRYASIKSPDKNGAEFRCAPRNGDDSGSALRVVSGYERAFALALKSLKTTRIDAINDQLRKDESRKNRLDRDSRGRVRRGGRQKIGEDLLPTTIFDFLWRLRSRSNYTETESLIYGARSLKDAYAFARAWVDMTGHLLAFTETLIAGRVGVRAMADSVSWFAERASASSSTQVAPVAVRWRVSGSGTRNDSAAGGGSAPA